MHPVAQKIAGLQRRITLRAYATAACASAATLLAGAIILGLADYLVRFRDPGLRIIATSAFVAIALYAAYRWWYRSGRKRLAPLAVARKIESYFPQLNDSLASAVEFLEQSEDDETAGSAQLRRMVVAEAESSTTGLPLDEAIDRRPLRRATAWLVAVCLVLGAWLAWDASAVRIAVARLVMPLGGAQWPRQHRLEFRDPPTRLAAGQSFEAELIDKNGNLPDEVRIVYRTRGGSRSETRSESMARVGDVMIARRDNVREPFAFRATGGDDDMMSWHKVDVIEPPRLKSLAIVIHPPAYTGLPRSSAERHINVLAGTRIELHGTATESLSGARILRDGEKPIRATVSGSGADGDNEFHIAPATWIATKSSPYSLELADTSGLAGVVGQWNLRVETDPPPSVSWQLPGDNLYVVSNAVVPIELFVKDNLAIEHVELAYERSDWSEAERERAVPAARIQLYRGPEKPVVISGDNAASGRGESRVVEYAWDLAPLQLPAGAEVSITGEAADYRPGVGKTVSPRRITIITPDELEARFAERMTQIRKQLERALDVERATREDIRSVELQLNQTRAFTITGGGQLQSAELNQRRVERILMDPNEGIPLSVEALARELEINRVTQTDVRAVIERLSAELDRLATGPLSVADHELAATRKATQDAALNAAGTDKNNLAGFSPDKAEAMRRALTAAGAAQDGIIAALERLVGELSGKSDSRRFARLLAELRRDQLAHEQATRTAFGVATLPLRVSDLTRSQQASLNTAAAGQNAIAARYSKIEQGMDALARELKQSEVADADDLADAVEMARSLAIGAKMIESARDIAENRLGVALDREARIAADLQRILDVLRGPNDGRAEQFATTLKNAEQRLNNLREQLTKLRQQIAELERRSGNTSSPQPDALNKQQQDLRRDINKLARQLDWLQAADAGQSARSAADRLVHQKPNVNQPRPQPTASSNDVQKAEHDLANAAQQLANRRQRADDDLALEFIRRLQTELADMVARQKRVIDQTAELQDARRPNTALPDAGAERITKLAGEERELAQMARDHSEVLHGLGAVRVSLKEAERRLHAAAPLLDRRDTGPDDQQTEQNALERLEAMLATFEQTADEARPDQPQPPNTGAGGQQPQRRPTFELLEVKMLRMLQSDLLARTREYEQRLAAIVGRTSPDTAHPKDTERARLQQEAQELAAEQGRLSELVDDMLTRDNKDD